MDVQTQAIKANIVTLALDAIVNAANSTLLGGGGVDGAIHRAAGPELVQECRRLGGSEPGGARITKGYRLPARYVIHTVGPVWQGGSNGEADVLASCYRRSLEVAVANGVRTVAFPSISTGIYGYPIELAAPIAVKAVRQFLVTNSQMDAITFCCFFDRDLGIYQEALANARLHGP